MKILGLALAAWGIILLLVAITISSEFLFYGTVGTLLLALLFMIVGDFYESQRDFKNKD